MTKPTSRWVTSYYTYSGIAIICEVIGLIAAASPQAIPKPGNSTQNGTELNSTTTPTTYCNSLSYCNSLPDLSLVCMVKCNLDDDGGQLRPYLSLVPELGMLLCKSVNTIFSTLPTYLRGQQSPSLKTILKLLRIKTEDEADFAKASANALIMASIKYFQSPIFDLFKPAVRKLEAHDDVREADQTGPVFPNKKSGLSTELTGQFVNKKCDNAQLSNEILTLVNGMKVRRCALDILMPGYFVFNHAPDMSVNKRIKSLVKAWNMPLVMLTGLRCCMTRFGLFKSRAKCSHKYKILSEPINLPLKNGPDTVCKSIPSHVPFERKSKPKTRKSSGTDATTKATKNPCEMDGANLFEECFTVNTAMEYSDEFGVGNQTDKKAQPEEIKSGEETKS